MLNKNKILSLLLVIIILNTFFLSTLVIADYSTDFNKPSNIPTSQSYPTLSQIWQKITGYVYNSCISAPGISPASAGCRASGISQFGNWVDDMSKNWRDDAWISESIYGPNDEQGNKQPTLVEIYNALSLLSSTLGLATPASGISFNSLNNTSLTLISNRYPGAEGNTDVLRGTRLVNSSITTAGILKISSDCTYGSSDCISYKSGNRLTISDIILGNYFQVLEYGTDTIVDISGDPTTLTIPANSTYELLFYTRSTTNGSNVGKVKLSFTQGSQAVSYNIDFQENILACPGGKYLNGGICDNTVAGYYSPANNNTQYQCPASHPSSATGASIINQCYVYDTNISMPITRNGLATNDRYYRNDYAGADPTPKQVCIDAGYQFASAMHFMTNDNSEGMHYYNGSAWTYQWFVNVCNTNGVGCPMIVSIKCADTFYYPNTLQTCPAGQYWNSTNGACENTLAGYYSPANDAVAYPADPGYYATGGSIAQTQCPVTHPLSLSLSSSINNCYKSQRYNNPQQSGMILCWDGDTWNKWCQNTTGSINSSWIGEAGTSYTGACQRWRTDLGQWTQLNTNYFPAGMLNTIPSYIDCKVFYPN